MRCSGTCERLHARKCSGQGGMAYCFRQTGVSIEVLPAEVCEVCCVTHATPLGVGPIHWSPQALLGLLSPLRTALLGLPPLRGDGPVTPAE